MGFLPHQPYCFPCCQLEPDMGGGRSLAGITHAVFMAVLLHLWWHFFYFVTIVIYVFFWCFLKGSSDLRHVWHIHRSGTRIYQTFMAYSVNMPLMSEIEIPLREKPMGKTPQKDAICRACCIKKEKSH